LRSAEHCVNPKCCGVYFESRVEHVKFVDFCGKYRIPLMQYLCSTRLMSILLNPIYDKMLYGTTHKNRIDSIFAV
jgi:hypothetical protein